MRWLTALCAFLSLGVTALVAWEFTPRSGEIQARRFVLRDDRWRRRAELSFRDDGGPALKFFGPEGRTNASLSLNQDGRGALKFSGLDGTDRARFGVNADGTPVLILADPDGLPGIEATAGGEGRAAIAIKKQGETVWRTP